MCDWHRLQWGNLYHQYLHQHFQMPWGYQQLVQMPWEYQQQYPYVRPITSHFANNSQCHCSARVPPSRCANESLCHCCPAHAPSRTCCIYATCTRGPYHCCTNGPLPVNTGYTSPLRCYPRRHPAMIEPYVPSRYAHGFKNADKYESPSEDEDGEDSSEDSSGDEDDSSSDSDSNNKIPTLSQCKQFLLKKKAEIKKKQYNGVDDHSSDNVSGNAVGSFSKYEQDFINDRAEQLLKQYKEEDYSDSVPSNQWSSARSFAIYEQVLSKIHEQLTEEDKEKEGFSFKIIDEPRDRPIFDSDDEDASDEDADEESSDDDKDKKDPSGEVEDIKSEEHTEPRYGVHIEMDAYGEVQHKLGRMTPTTLEDNLLKQELKEFVYGDKADAICGQETLMISKFDRLADMSLPILWPVHPINP